MQKEKKIRTSISKGRKGFVAALFILGSMAMVMVGWAICSAHCDRKHFDHALHIEVIDDPGSCVMCHLDEHESFAGLPILETCKGCHDDSDTQVWEQVETIMQRVNFEKHHRKI